MPRRPYTIRPILHNLLGRSLHCLFRRPVGTGRILYGFLGLLNSLDLYDLMVLGGLPYILCLSGAFFHPQATIPAPSVLSFLTVCECCCAQLPCAAQHSPNGLSRRSNMYGSTRVVTWSILRIALFGVNILVESRRWSLTTW